MNRQIVELYQTVAGRLLKYLVANGCAEAQAEDIVQEIWYNAGHGERRIR